MAERHGPRRWTLVAVCGSTFMPLIDIYIVQVALPTIHRRLGGSFTDLQWVSIAREVGGIGRSPMRPRV